MGLTKQYLRYTSCGLFNVIASAKCNVLFVTFNGVSGRYVVAGACENCYIWDLRLGEKVLTLKGDNSEVCVIIVNPNNSLLAAGYQDGSVRIFDLNARENDDEDRDCSKLIVTLKGHKSAVTSLSFDDKGLRLLSGSKDTDIILWDVVNECGEFRLKGHKSIITQCRFINSHIVVSTSADSSLKFWDLNIQHCFKTLVGHRCEVKDVIVLNDGKRIITGASDSLLRGWDLELNDIDNENEKKSKLTVETHDEEENENESNILSCHNIGTITRLSKSPLSRLTVRNNKVLACHGTDRVLEVYRIISGDEYKKKIARKAKKARKAKLKNAETDNLDDSEEPRDTSLELNEEIKKIGFIKTSSKIKAFDLHLDNSKEIVKFVVLTSNNSLEIYELNLSKEEIPTEPIGRLTSPGHQTDVRTLCFSSDSTALLSGSGDTIKIWNRSTNKCIRTMKCDYALSSIFVPGDRHCIIGTKSGKLQLFDLASSTELASEEGHTGPVWSLCLTPDARGFASGSGDKMVKFWEFELITDSDLKTSKRLNIVHTRTLSLQEDVLCVRFSKDYRLLAVSLLDSTVKIFFVDTLKFFLSLYGHKFPVLCMDISDDSTLIATGSSDKNVKLWGLDFGDCHKSIFAHGDSITCLQFIPKTHMFFTGGRDGCVKQWDGDNFQRITTLKGHHAEVWALAISPNAHCVASASHDKSIRLWEKTEEIVVLEDERETEREEEFEKTLSNKDDTVVAGEANQETGLPSKRNAENLTSAERLIEGLDIYKEETEKLKEFQRIKKESAKRKVKLVEPTLHPLMMYYKSPTPDHLMLQILKQIKSSDLEEALLILPFNYVIQLMKVLDILIEKGWSIELCCRCLCFLSRVHHGQITANEILVQTIDRLRTSTVDKVKSLKDLIGHNRAGVQYLQRIMESKQDLKLFFDATKKYEEKSKSKKRKAKLLERAIIINK